MPVWILASRKRNIVGMNASTNETRRTLPPALQNWRERHRHPFNFWIHLVGIPLAVAGLVLLIVRWDEWYWGVGLLVVGYLLQWLGHRVEGNDVGEWAGIKRLLGLPYVGISPRWQGLPQSHNEHEERAI
jgi:hypothetical protein